MAENVTILYRIVAHNPPTREDVLSYQELGIALTRRDPEALRLAAGISLYNTFQQARNQARRLPPAQRGFIAELRIPFDAPVTIERSTSTRGHYTLWGSPDGILGYVARVVPHDTTSTGGV
ncbi:MAG: hypothetical protein M3499_07210 [Actinomycetota bacterium]|nr:hypothetical protein [Actinomycetota bacterium]